jgi:hypothetical protein
MSSAVSVEYVSANELPVASFYSPPTLTRIIVIKAEHCLAYSCWRLPT